MLKSFAVLGDLFYIFFRFRNVLRHAMCQINYDRSLTVVENFLNDLFQKLKTSFLPGIFFRGGQNLLLC